jgi:hypothetical protein
MVEYAREMSGENGDDVSVDMRVLVYPGTSDEACGVVVDDFGETAGSAVHVGDFHIAPARRWAVLLDTGTLVFIDSADLVPE